MRRKMRKGRNKAKRRKRRERIRWRRRKKVAKKKRWKNTREVWCCSNSPQLCSAPFSSGSDWSGLCFSWYSSVPPEKWRGNILDRLRSLHVISFPVHHPSVILPFDVIQPEILTAL
jgi:hypothetical protein